MKITGAEALGKSTPRGGCDLGYPGEQIPVYDMIYQKDFPLANTRHEQGAVRRRRLCPINRKPESVLLLPVGRY